MSEQSTGGTDRQESDDLEAEAEALVDLFNSAAADHSPNLDWFAMGLNHETMDESYVLEAERYIDADGLDALREVGRTVNYVEAYQKPPENEVYCQIQVPVQNEIPDRPVQPDTDRSGDGDQ